MSTTNKPEATVEMTTEQRVKKYLTAFTESKMCPVQVQPHLVKFTPQIAKACQALTDLIPYVELAYQKIMELWEKLRPYKPELLLPSLIGFIMCFFGGSFLTLIAAVEAFRMCGYETVVNSVKILHQDFVKVTEEMKKDDKKDDNNDGVADVNQISNQELVTRKAMLFLRTVEPIRITTALAAINAGFLAVIVSTFTIPFCGVFFLYLTLFNVMLLMIGDVEVEIR